MQQLQKGIGIVLILAIISLSGCSKKATLSNSATVYNEDLSHVRPHFQYKAPILNGNFQEPAIEKENLETRKENTLAVTNKLNSALEAIKSQNKSIKYINGFRIQIYVGNIRQDADNAKSYIYRVFPELVPYMSYAQPTYRVKAGDFMYRGDAQTYLDQIRDQYSSAVILPERVEIQKSLSLNSTFEN